ncbi:MAG TPA: peptide deformylase, partial [Terriglobia bacterium]|nr:peptide deformylase [Terriglobia bacterium]
MLRPIVLYGAEVLAKPSRPVTNISDAEIQLVKDMVETMYKAPGVGLAAPQVGVGKRIMVTDPSAGE